MGRVRTMTGCFSLHLYFSIQQEKGKKSILFPTLPFLFSSQVFYPVIFPTQTVGRPGRKEPESQHVAERETTMKKREKFSQTGDWEEGRRWAGWLAGISCYGTVGTFSHTRGDHKKEKLMMNVSRGSSQPMPLDLGLFSFIAFFQFLKSPRHIFILIVCCVVNVTSLYSSSAGRMVGWLVHSILRLFVVKQSSFWRRAN